MSPSRGDVKCSPCSGTLLQRVFVKDGPCEVDYRLFTIQVWVWDTPKHCAKCCQCCSHVAWLSKWLWTLHFRDLAVRLKQSIPRSDVILCMGFSYRLVGEDVSCLPRVGVVGEGCGFCGRGSTAGGCQAYGIRALASCKPQSQGWHASCLVWFCQPRLAGRISSIKAEVLWKALQTLLHPPAPCSDAPDCILLPLPHFSPRLLCCCGFICMQRELWSGCCSGLVQQKTCGEERNRQKHHSKWLVSKTKP